MAKVPDWEMASIYESSLYMVVLLGTQYGAAYEVVDKTAGEEVVLIGPTAEAFRVQRDMWERHTPTEDAVHEVLEQYLALGRLPLVIH